MPAVHSRETIIKAEGFWGKLIFVQEDGIVKPFWNSRASGNGRLREEVREMVGILGSLVFEMIIWIS